ncbi:MAG: tricorn protease [Gaiellaceae bacterium]|jgi:Tol biopolymer transport system component|nr:tricorn protease [Gaiellaceae bacterium]
MKRALACLCLLSLTGCGTGHARVSPSLRPAPNVLVYATAPPTRHWVPRTENVWRANVDGGHPKLIARNSSDPTVSPDGRSIAYDHGGDVLVVPAAGGKPRIVYRDGAYPTWAPDSRHLAVSGGDGLVVILDLKTGTKHAIPGDAGTPSFSPDSTRVVYSVGRTGGDLYVASIDGGRPIRITDDRRSSGPVWGPDGIAFVRYARAHDWHNDIWLTGPRPNAAHQLTHLNSDIYPVAFSKDGKELLAAYPAFHNGQLWAVDVPTGRARAITPSVGDLNPRGLSDDGRTVLASVGCPDVAMPSPYGVLETIPFAGGKSHIIVRGPCSGSWNADF